MSQLNSNFQTPRNSPGFLLWKINNKWQAMQRKALASYELTHVQFVLLATLAWSGNSQVTQKQLATLAGTDIMMTSQVLRVLEKRSLVRRATAHSDKRAVEVSLTKEGQSLVNDAVIEVERVDKEFFSKLENNVHTFTILLKELGEY